MKLISIPAAIMAAVSFYVGLNYLLLYFRRRSEFENLAFAATCISIGFYDVFCAGLYNASSVSNGLVWQRGQFAFLAVFTISVSWFIYLITKFRSWIPFAAITAGSVIFLILGIFVRNGLTLTDKNPFIKKINIRDIAISYYEADPGYIYVFQYIFMLSTAGFILYILLKNYIDDENPQFQPILFSLLIFFAAAFNDSLIGAGVYSFIYLLEYAYMFIILSMAYVLQNSFIALHHEVEELTHQLEDKVNERTMDLFLSEITHNLYTEIPESNITVTEKINEAVHDSASHVSTLSQDISIIMNIDKLLKRSLDKAVEISGAANGYLYINSAAGGAELKCMTGTENPPDNLKDIADKAINNSMMELTVNNNAGKDISQLLIPLVLDEKTHGLCCLYKKNMIFENREKMLAGNFIRQAAAAFENAFLYQRMIDRNAVTRQMSVSPNIEEKIKKAIAYIQINYNSDISREGLAASINMHPDSFGRFFKIYTNRKISEFINELRIMDAAAKLRETDDNIIDIAFSVGFESIPTFNRAFLKVMKVTPTRFREENQ